jgi:galactonate dehydratase
MSNPDEALAGGRNLRNLSAAVQNSTTVYQRPKLKITDVRTAEIKAHGYQVHVRVYTDQGVFGHGEATDAAHGAVPLINVFKQFLIGQDPLNVDFLFENLRAFGVFAGAQGGQYVTALTGLEIALWDLAGKALGLPIYQLLGGKMRDRIRLYCDTATPTLGDPAAREGLQKVKDLGFTALKIDVDEQHSPWSWDTLRPLDWAPPLSPVKVNLSASNAEIDRMIKKVALVREAFDPRIDLAVDMHAQYDVSAAKRLAAEVEPFKLFFLEEPLPAENVQGLRDIRESTKTPIATGENLYLRHGFREIFEKHAVDIIQPDIQKCGGLLEARKISDMAHIYYVSVSPHCVVSPLGTMASCHVCAAIPNFLALEWHWLRNLQLWRNFVKEGDIIDKGYVAVTDRPGIGVEMNEEAARSAQVPGTPWFNSGDGK